MSFIFGLIFYLFGRACIIKFNNSDYLEKEGGTIEHFGLLSLLPSIIALTLAIVTKRVVLSLLSGILIGTIIIDASTNGFIHSIIYSIVNLFAALAGTPANEEAGVYGMGLVKDASRAELVIIVLLLGAFIGVLNKSGGAYAFGQWLAGKVKTAEGAQASASAMGVSLFTSAYFSSLATGAVFRPVFDRLKISREKLAFFLDSTSAPINTLVPISGWVAFMGALMVDNIESVEDPIQGLIRTIPFNFYNIVILIIVFLFAFNVLKDFGPMKRAEDRVRKGYAYSDRAQEEKSKEDINQDARVSDMLLPLGTSVFLLVFLGLWNYTFVQFFGVPEIPIGGNMLLIVSFTVGMAIAYIQYISRGVMSSKMFFEEAFEGAKSVLLGAMIIILAVTLGDVMRAPAPEGTGAAFFIEQSVGDIIPASVVPVSVFIISAFVSFSMGTSFGTWAIMMPIGITLMVATGGDPFLAAAAILSGGAFGDHTSPISDTSLMSSIGADVEHMDHINTQLPYALTGAAIAAVMFLAAGFIF